MGCSPLRSKGAKALAIRRSPWSGLPLGPANTFPLKATKLDRVLYGLWALRDGRARSPSQPKLSADMSKFRAVAQDLGAQLAAGGLLDEDQLDRLSDESGQHAPAAAAPLLLPTTLGAPDSPPLGAVSIIHGHDPTGLRFRVARFLAQSTEPPSNHPPRRAQYGFDDPGEVSKRTETRQPSPLLCLPPTTLEGQRVRRHTHARAKTSCLSSESSLAHWAEPEPRCSSTRPWSAPPTSTGSSISQSMNPRGGISSWREI